MSGELIFEEPPGARGGRAGSSAIGQWLTSLREHPGQWVKFPAPQKSSASSGNIGRGRYGAAPGEFEASSRSAGDGTFWLYARYVGSPDGES